MSVSTSGTAASSDPPKSNVVTKAQPSQSDRAPDRQSPDAERSVAVQTTVPETERKVDANEKTSNTKRWAFTIVSVACLVAIASAAAYVLVLGAFLRYISTEDGPTK